MSADERPAQTRHADDRRDAAVRPAPERRTDPKRRPGPEPAPGVAVLLAACAAADAVSHPPAA